MYHLAVKAGGGEQAALTPSRPVGRATPLPRPGGGQDSDFRSCGDALMGNTRSHAEHDG